MGMAPLNIIGPVVGSATAAVVFTTVSQYVPSRRLELCSEIVCWAVLPFLFRYTALPNTRSTSPLLNDPQDQRHSSLSQWIAAFGIVAAAFYRAESNTIGFYPLLTPLLLTVQTYSQSSISSDPVLTSPLISTIKGTTLVAVLSAFSLSNGDLFGSLTSIILVASLFIVYSIFSPGFKVKILSLSSVDIETNSKAIAGRTIILLFTAVAFQTLVLGPPNSNIPLVLFTGLVKALSWFFTIQAARQTSWCIATTIGTFALACTGNPFSQNSQLQALSHVAVSTLTLYQTTQLLPKQYKGKILLWFCLSASFIPYLYNEYMIHDASFSTFTSPSHPIKLLTQEAAPLFHRKLLNQSRTYPEAVRQYKQRYGIDPPPGFEAWFQYALKHNSPIIDEFDMIHSAVSPFLKLSGKEVSEMIGKVYKMPQSEVWLCEFSGKTAKTKCHHPSRSYDRHYSYILDKLLWSLPGVLPDVKFLINHFDEPRVIIPSPGDGVDKAIRLSDVSMKPTWDALTKSCPSHKTYRDDQSRVETFGLPFVKDHLSESDLCKHPEYKDMHGAFISPKTFRLIEGLAPVLSTGAFSTMGDILFPSPAYVEEEFQYDKSHDIPWSEKKNNLYWTGSTTGGYALDDQWRNHQRQRFVTLAQNLGKQEHTYLRERNGVISSIKSWFLNGRLYDVGFTRIFQCDRKFCRDQKTFFPVKPWADKDAALHSKLAFDLDGNGISGRYYKLLSSNTLPLKQALLREWHDERLVPWVHYIPVSQSLEELPELVSYLTSNEAGQRVAEKVARQGREWMGKAVREVDMTIYTWRLLLELARLQDPMRRGGG
ncbi:beta-1 2-xylosyltransferase 1 [Fusarium pseudocircinatum]|uniref:Beta-1 2-xylosyltransferase 1 n=1 Tax=Fusarium pseudocircinatum TaxID=56676 RepID=A0A8H5L2D5_9HYPO|nr:beta-1 2-xylosyltransferase 1 [Fusarium pseudocircinatum]